MTPEEQNPHPSVHHQTIRGARLALARKEISQDSYRAVLAGELSLPDAKSLGRDRGPGTTQGSSGPGKATEIPGRASAGSSDAPQEASRSCLCGCGQWPRSQKSRFIQGHDHRLYGELKRNLQHDPLLRNERFDDAQRRYAVERGLVGPEVLPEEERDG